MLACMCVHSQLCPPLWDAMDCSLPGSSVNGIFPARILEWVAISSFRESLWPRDRTHASCVSCVGRWISGSAVKGLAYNADLGSIPGLGSAHSSILAWRIPWTVCPPGHKEADTTEPLSLSLSWLLCHPGPLLLSLRASAGSKGLNCRARLPAFKPSITA